MGVEAVKSGMTPGFADALPTWKTNAPRIGWVSAETTLQATVYVPSARSGFSAIATVLSSGRSSAPLSTRSPVLLKTRTPPNAVSTGSL